MIWSFIKNNNVCRLYTGVLDVINIVMKIVLKDKFLSWFVGLFSPWMDPLIDPLPETHIVVGSLLYTTRFRFKTGLYFGRSKKEFLKFYQIAFVYELYGTAKSIFKMSSMYHTYSCTYYQACCLSATIGKTDHQKST